MYAGSLGNELKRTRRPGRGTTHLIRGALFALTALALTSCQGSMTDLSLSDSAGLVLTPLFGPELAGSVGNPTDERVRVQVSDDQGRPVAGVSVEFQVVSEDGSVTPSFVRSNAHGIVEADWVLGERAGEHALEVIGVNSRRPRDRIIMRVPAWARAREAKTIELTPAAASVEVGAKQEFQARARDQFGNEVNGLALEWSVADSSIASPVGAGEFRGIAPGSTEVQVAAQGGLRATATLTVEAAEPDHSLAITPRSLELTGTGATAQISAKLTNGSGQEVQGAALSWISMDTRVVTISPGGLVTARGAGVALLTVAAACCSATDTITVTVHETPATASGWEGTWHTETNGQPATLVVEKSTVTATVPELSFVTPATIQGETLKAGPFSSAAGVVVLDLRRSGDRFSGTVSVNGVALQVVGVKQGTTPPSPDPEGPPDPESPSDPGEPSQPEKPPVSGDVLFFDDFESGDFSAPGGGLRWGKPNRTSIVRSDGCAVHNGSPVRNCGDNRVRRWESGPGGGNHALRIRYPAGQNMAEQRFTLPEPMDEVWISYWIRVPHNFSHPGGNNNQKFFALWQDNYEYQGSGATATFQFRRSGDGSRVANYQILPGSGSSTSRHTGESGSAMLWTTADRGRWMKVVIHARNGTNGVVEQWVRWEGTRSWTQAYRNSGNLGSQPWSAGYLMGWANAPYSQDTEFLIDDFTVSRTSLLD
jgi:hypothetical protein